MKAWKHMFGGVLGLMVATAPAAATPANPSSVEVAGTIGLAQADVHACLAVWVPMNQDVALNGIIWYNNDGAAGFPAVSVQGGGPDYPVALSEAFSVAEDVTGPSLGWSELSFDQPIVTEEEGLYVVFEVPVGGVATAAGAGGGPGLGYTTAVDGLPGWLTADGEDWMRVHPDYGLAVIPQFARRTAGMLAKAAVRRAGEHGGQEGLAIEVDHPVAALLSHAAPNPFNPQTTLQMALAQDGMIELAIYNLRGVRVRTLASRTMTAGVHEVTWNGSSDDGQALPSGVYLARLVAGPVTSVQRLTLLR
jgi:hypothetical protein